MKRWITVAGIVLLGVAAVVVSERRKVDVPPGPAAVLYLVADTEQELTRMPVHFTRMSDDEEIAIGNQLASFYRAGREDRPDPEQIEIQRYVESVGSNVATHAHRKLPYMFHYLPDAWLINAFALPGGHVYIGQGLLSMMDSEDELAAVLGHEIEHIDHYHCAERVQQEQAFKKIPLGDLFALPIEIFEVGYSKNQELEADREGTQLAVSAGYSANGAIRMFETFQSLYEEYHSRSKMPEQELTQTAQQTLDGYFRSHPLPSERIAQIQKMIADNGWKLVAERDLQVAYITWARKAQDALSAHQYEKAQQLATRSLKIKPNRKAFQSLAQAEFAQANFRAAAVSYRQLLQMGEPDADIATAYAASLAAADRHNAATEFQSWLSTIQGSKPDALEVPLAGLSLLAGNPTPAQKIALTARQAARMNTTDWAPRWLADLAWWYYLAGDYTTALDLINDAIQQRPSEADYWIRRSWIEIQQRRLADASESLERYQGPGAAASAMAHAVLYWQEKTANDSALMIFDTAIQGQPEWQNQHWVQALYSPLIVESVQQMQTERDRQKKPSLARAK